MLGVLLCLKSIVGIAHLFEKLRKMKVLFSSIEVESKKQQQLMDTYVNVSVKVSKCKMRVNRCGRAYLA